MYLTRLTGGVSELQLYNKSTCTLDAAFPFDFKEEMQYNLDPQGDVVLVLRNPDAPFAVWDETYGIPDLQPESSSQSTISVLSQTEFADAQSTFADSPPKSPSAQAPSDVRFLLSSRHLILASEYFYLALQGPWKEGNTTSSDSRRYVYTDDWDTKALHILMQVIHGRNNGVPKLLDLELLAKIAVLVDYYKCHEAVKICSDMWIEKLTDPLPTSCNRELVLWHLIASVFEQRNLFKDITKVALQHGLGPFPTLGLPIIDVAGR